MKRLCLSLVLFGWLVSPAMVMAQAGGQSFEYDCNSSMIFINFKSEAWINQYETKISVEKMMIPLKEVKNVYLMEDQKSVVIITDYLNSFSRFISMEEAGRFMGHVYQCLNLIE